MTSTKELKSALLMQLENLPESKIQDVLDFVNSLLFNESYYQSQYENKRGETHPDKNLLIKFIGGVSHGSLAKEIDKDLYGP